MAWGYSIASLGQTGQKGAPCHAGLGETMCPVGNEGEAGASALQRFARLVNEDPHAQMFLFADERGEISHTLSRTDLDQHASSVAALLQQQGIGPGDRVLLAYSFSIDVVPAILGCLFAGVVPAPIAPPNPMRLEADLPRFEQIARDSGCRAVLTNGQYRRYRRLATLRSPWLTRGTLWRSLPWLRTDGLPAASSHESADGRHSPLPGDIAFLQYTSGSTSEPKGVMISHRNLAAQIDAGRSRTRLDGSSRLMAWIPYYHDHCLVGGIFNVMLGGGHFCLMSPLTFLKNPAAWFDVLTRLQSTGTAAPDFAYRYALERTSAAQREKWDLSSIEIFQSGGEPILPASVDAFFDVFSHCGLRADAFSPGYGMAEHVLGIAIAGRERISVDRLQYETNRRVVLSESADALTLIGNGRPLDGVRVEIVDPTSCRRLGPDEVGEIWVHSRSVAAGYWGRPEMTADTFDARLADDPEGAGFLRTGDLGFLHGAELYVSGRIKDTIIVRGRNIYPQDVELLASRAHSLIRPGRATAFSVAGSDGHEALAIAVEVRGKTLPVDMARAITGAVREQVTGGLNVTCPTVILLRPDTIFKTTSGKLQRGRTRASYVDGAMAARVLWQDTLPVEPGPAEVVDPPGEGPFTQAGIESWLVERVARIEGLPASEIDLDSPLGRFAIDSLAMTGLVAELATWSGRDLRYEMLNETGSLRALARAVHACNVAPSVSADGCGITVDTLLPLNPSQAWLMEPEGPVPHGWSIGVILLSPIRLEPAVLQRALDRVVAHHDALRLRLVQTDEGWRQRVLPVDAPRVELVELTTLRGEALRDAIERETASRQQSLHMLDGPIVRLAVFRPDGPERDRLLLLVHHIALDAYSFELVLSDLMRVYDNLRAERPAALLPPSASYGEWMAELTRLAGSDAVRACAGYWLELPRSSPVPANDPAGTNTNGDFESQISWITAQTSHSLLRAVPAQSGVPTSILVLTALLRELHGYTGASAHTFELPHYGRQQALPGLDLSRAVGWISNNFPVHLCLPTDLPSIQQAKAVQAQVAVVGRDGLDYGLLRYMDGDPQVRRDMRAAAQPTVKFNWYGQTYSLMQSLVARYPLAPETVGLSYEADQSMPYELYFYGWVIDGRIRLEVGCSAARYSDETRARLLSGWLAAADSLVTDAG